MITDSKDPVAWHLLVSELSDAQEHLEQLVGRMTEAGQIDVMDFQVQLAHIYAHLNRAWNGRDESRAEITTDEWSAQSQFPTDIKPL